MFNAVRMPFENFLGAMMGPVMASWFANILTAFFLLALGLFVGKVTKWAVKRVLVSQSKVRDGPLQVLKWAVYVIFAQAAIIALQVPMLSRWLTRTIVVIPALLATLFVLILGYTCAVALRTWVLGCWGKEGRTLANIVYHFSIYLGLISAMQVLICVRLLPIGYHARPVLLTALTLTYAIAVAWHYGRGK